MYADYFNTSMNDLCMYNIVTNEWESLALYGQIPTSRWGASMIAVNHSKLILFGGCNLKKYQNSLLYTLECDPKEINKLN